jgi:hypothetical protein
VDRGGDGGGDVGGHVGGGGGWELIDCTRCRRSRWQRRRVEGSEEQRVIISSRMNMSG